MNALIDDDQAKIGLYNQQQTLSLASYFLFSQPPLNDFINHNLLHGFQGLQFEDRLDRPSRIFGYQVHLPLEEYRSLYQLGRISRAHATNAVRIVGRRDLFRGLFGDRCPFINSYNYASDPNGDTQYDILSTAMPVCTGINPEYFFREPTTICSGPAVNYLTMSWDFWRVANGIGGDLRPGLPS